LQHLNLYSLKYRRLRGDMIEVFKILHHMYDSSVAPELIRNTSTTRGNNYKLLNHTFHYNFRKFSFAARIVNIWNSLPDYVVDVNSNRRSIGVYSRKWLESWKKLLIKIRIKRHKCLHPFSSLLIAIYELTEHLYLSTQTVCDNIDRRHDM